MQAFLEKDKDTICAVSTPPGHGGIAVLRISGDRALSLTRKICPDLPLSIESHRVYFAKIVENLSKCCIDETLVTYFSQGRSYTGEETIEISCHGSQFITQKIINELTLIGCRLAEKGEFTYRAFINNKIDLVQAESVLNLIQSQSQRASNQAIRQLQGELSHCVSEIEDELLFIGAHLEAQIDFVEQDIEPQLEKSLLSKLSITESKINSLSESFSKGRLLKEGLKVVLLGLPNVGKSSLLNALLVEDKAIVTSIPGTTRDVVSGSVLHSGIEVSFFDTAGIRESDNEIERIGINKSLKELQTADIVFVVVDATNINLPDINPNDFQNKNIYLLLNKIDQISSLEKINKIKTELLVQTKLFFKDQQQLEILEISALTKKGIDNINKLLIDFISMDSSENSIAVVSSRQYEALRSAADYLERAKEQLTIRSSPEFPAFDVKNAIIEIHKLLGKEYDDQIMDRVFSEFCLGK
ncbi:MAG: tRNA uridine-5-carboxymethylaminomethyl(34) synthesis GTPase MnmE [Bdellovibrionaceae bacterium]|nr:tRNA uridine-5-carboxymethylaminomethyl(34) synthesis GTPase MnmE [Pseudobdellovibrionaceae bacterium]